MFSPSEQLSTNKYSRGGSSRSIPFTSVRYINTRAVKPQRSRGKKFINAIPVAVKPVTPPVLPVVIRPTVQYLPSILGSTVLALVPVLIIHWDINPISHPNLFNPEIPGSLWHNLTPGLLNAINAGAAGHPGLVPIILVHDMAYDPSFIVRTFKGPVIYMWTLKPAFWTKGCAQYVGQTNNARNRFGKNYNSPSYLSTHPSLFNNLLQKHGPQAFWVTIISVSDSSAAVWQPVETFFIALFNTIFNTIRVSGSMVGVVTRVLSAQTLAAKRVTALANLPKVSYVGENNPFYQRLHTPEARLAISMANGTAVSVFELLADGSTVLLGTYNSGRKASDALALIGIHISRPTVISYLRKGTVFEYDNRRVYFIGQ